MGQTESHEFTPTGGSGPEIKLNIYKPTQNQGPVGVYHSGIEFNGIEYAYGGGSVSESGVYQQTPKEDPPGGQWAFYKTIDLGKAKLDSTKARNAISDLGQKFRADAYHLTKNNCNHFTHAAAKVLGVAVNYPSFVNNAASLGAKFGIGGEYNGEPVEVEETKTVFESTKGYRLDDNPSTSTKQKDTDAQTQRERHNPWRDPNFRPGRPKPQSQASQQEDQKEAKS